MHNSLLLSAHGDVFNGASLHPNFVYERSEDSVSSFAIHAIRNKKNYNMKYHVILGRFKWLINVSPSLEGIRYPRSEYVLSFVCFFLLLLLFLYSLEKQFGWFLTHISRLHI